MPGEAIAWGCWSCGSSNSRVRFSDVDDDGVRVRRRSCLDCGEDWDTEERRIAKGAYNQRALHKRESSYRRRHSQMRTCVLCDLPYRYGTYASHRKVEVHRQLEEKRRAKDVARRREYQRWWARMDRAARKAAKEAANVVHGRGLAYVDPRNRQPADVDPLSGAPRPRDRD